MPRMLSLAEWFPLCNEMQLEAPPVLVQHFLESAQGWSYSIHFLSFIITDWICGRVASRVWLPETLYTTEYTPTWIVYAVWARNKSPLFQNTENCGWYLPQQSMPTLTDVIILPYWYSAFPTLKNFPYCWYILWCSSSK